MMLSLPTHWRIRPLWCLPVLTVGMAVSLLIGAATSSAGSSPPVRDAITSAITATATAGPCPFTPGQRCVPWWTPSRTPSPTGTPPATPTPACSLQANYQVVASTSAGFVPANNYVSGSRCNACVVNVTLPFPYTFYDQTFTSVNISNKGNLQFSSASTSGNNTCLPATSLNNAIIAYWDDLNTNINDTMGMYTGVIGIAPNRVFAVRWKAGHVASDAVFNFEVLLYEGTGPYPENWHRRFDVIYGNVTQRGYSATIGAQEGTGSRSIQHSCNTMSINPGTRLTFYQFGSTPAVLNSRLFPPDNIWNRNIATLPTHTMSDAYIASINGPGPTPANLNPAFGSRNWQAEPGGQPWAVVTGSQTPVPVCFLYWQHSDSGPYPLPTNAPIQQGPQSSGDRHVIVVERDSNTLYEMWKSYPEPGGNWRAGLGARWDMNSNCLRPDGFGSADAAGLPILPGLVRYDEVARGVITHALRFTAPDTQLAHIWPARHHASNAPNPHDPNLPPMGLRLRLKASVDISGYPSEVQVILQALKHYGMFLADNGGRDNGQPVHKMFISGEHYCGWNDTQLNLMRGITASDFEAVDQSGLMIHPDSGQSR